MIQIDRDGIERHLLSGLLAMDIVHLGPGDQLGYLQLHGAAGKQAVERQNPTMLHKRLDLLVTGAAFQ